MCVHGCLLLLLLVMMEKKEREKKSFFDIFVSYFHFQFSFLFHQHPPCTSMYAAIRLIIFSLINMFSIFSSSFSSLSYIKISFPFISGRCAGKKKNFLFSFVLISTWITKRKKRNAPHKKMWSKFVGRKFFNSIPDQNWN